MSMFENQELRRWHDELASTADDAGIAEAGLDPYGLEGSGDQLLLGATPDDVADFVEELVRVARPEESIEIGNWLVTELLVESDELPLDVVQIAAHSEGFPDAQIGWVLSRGNTDVVAEGLTNAIERSGDPNERGRYARLLRHSQQAGGTTIGPVFGGGVEMAAPGPPFDIAGVQPNERARVVSTGISGAWGDGSPLSSDRTLTVIEQYCIWLEIGDPQSGALDDVVAELPDIVPADAELDVVLFQRSGDVSLDSSATAVIALRGDQSPIVVEPSYEPDYASTTRVYFLVRPQKEGEHTVRCNIYYRQTLVQSRVVSFIATSTERDQHEALGVQLDFSLQTSFDQRWFDDREPHLLSLLINVNPDGSHQFMFHGVNDGERHVSSAVIAEGEINTLVSELREGLRLASYGSDDAYDDRFQNQFRHGTPNPDELRDDLVRMAVRGHRVYLRIARQIAPPTAEMTQREAREQLERMIRRPGFVQIATKVSPTLLIPAGLIYDHPTSVARRGHVVCDAFLAALDGGGLLVDEPCFRGDCPNYDDVMVVCPSGFWAYRHRIGTPCSSLPSVDLLTGDPTEIQNDSVSHIPFTSRPQMVVGHAASLSDFAPHLSELQALDGIEISQVVSDREQLFPTLEEAHPQVVYFYCHGGVAGTLPFLEIGDRGSTLITPETIQTQCYWPDDRPLVFLNGCRTTALSPHDAHEFVTAFTGEPMASGVIGTEVTIVEDLARPFAEFFFSELQPGADGRSQTLGEAIRRARLRLLGNSNPLGLVYSPFVMPDVRLVRSN